MYPPFRILVAIVVGVAAQNALAAGMTTHALAAERAIPYLQSDTLTQILLANRSAVLSGGSFPDSGYIPPLTYGEVSHWERFINAYAAHIGRKPECGDVAGLQAADGPCAGMIAHLMGAAAHGMMDETWDWLFEPQVADHNEDPTHVLPDPTGTISSIEYAMDMIAIYDFYRWPDMPVYPPPVEDLVQVYESIGVDVGAEQLAGGYAGVNAVLAAERAGAASDSHRVRLSLPWSSSHFYAESGGVIFSAQAVAGYMESVWQKVLNNAPSRMQGGAEPVHPAPVVVAVHPLPNETGVSCDYDPPRTSAGPRGGGASNRIVAVISNSILRNEGGPDVAAEAFRVYRGRIGQSGPRVTALDGYPAPGPYGNGDGTHTVMFYPGHDLEPETWYSVVLTDSLLDRQGVPLEEEYRWEFKTGADPDGHCGSR